MSCSIKQDDNLYNLHYRLASDLSIQDSLLILCGTAKDSHDPSSIKSPFILHFKQDLTKTDSQFFQSKTTAVHPTYMVDTEIPYALLSYYRAADLTEQEEISIIHRFDKAFQQESTFSFGYRTRIKTLKPLDQNQYVTLSYERETQSMSLHFIRNSNIESQINFEEGMETNIPTDLVVSPSKEIFFSGIANGFHYPDGHNYKQQSAYGFIIKTDSSGIETNRFIYKQTGHAFVNDIHYDEDHIYAIATVQSNSTGMDLHCIKLDKGLDQIWNIPFVEKGTQEGSKLIMLKQTVYLLGTTESGSKDKVILQVHKINKNGDLIWRKNVGQSHTFLNPADMVYWGGYLYIVSNTRKSRTAGPQILLQKISLDGIVIDQVTIE